MGKIILLLFIAATNVLFAQPGTGSMRGRIVDLQTGTALREVQLLLPRIRQLFSTDSNGYFSISGLPQGACTVQVLTEGEVLDSFFVAIGQAPVDLGAILVHAPVLNPAYSTTADIPVLALERIYTEDDGIQSNAPSMLLNAAGTKDPFLNAATFSFGQYNFRPRGYDRQNQQVYLNGLLMNDPASGTVLWARWSGLNDVFKNQSITYGSGLHQQAYGGVNGTVYFDAGAFDQPVQNKVSYALSNRAYNNRLMLTHSTGERKSSWAHTVSLSRRWAEEGYVPGTFLDAWSGFASVGKVLNERNRLTVTLIAAHTVRGRSGAATEEVYQLTGNPYYNPNWGWQGNEKRNARVSRLLQPLVILQYEYKLAEHLVFSTSLGFQTGTGSVFSLDWYNAIDPRADYYRNLPGYYASNPSVAQQLQEKLSGNPEQLQLNWSRFYAVNAANRETLQGLNGGNDSISGRRSLYVIGADEEQARRISWGSQLQRKYSEQLTLSGGAQLSYQYTRYARRLTDLLGGDYFLNYNMFAIQQYPSQPDLHQHDLDHPDRAVKAGERYRYHYAAIAARALLWGQCEMEFRKITMFSSLRAGYSTYQRIGFYRNGLYPSSSAGASPLQSFATYAAKAGLTWKLNGRNYLILNAALSMDEPAFDHVFIAPRLRNQVIAQAQLQRTGHMETGYLLRAPRANFKAVLYATGITNTTIIKRFYNDEPQYQSFVNFVMDKINTQHTGIELALNYDVTRMISWNIAAALGQAFYTNRPSVRVYNDNDTATRPGTKEVFIKNYYLGTGRQSVYTTGITYNSKRFWYLRLNANYIDRNYVAVNPARRSVEAAEFIEQSDPAFLKIFGQEKLPAAFTLDLSGGKSFRLNKINKRIRHSTTLYLNFGLNNVWNKRQIKLIGYEQLRYDFTNNNPEKFPSKYIYAFGRTFFANLSVKF
ncbi:MAG: hypothetical protein JNL13_13460 [Chitinophagaceae bacterium]|nr:hypothetical protein [Chitinophagaceae bacterium]